MTTQLETLRQFPLTMQWRGEWDITTQYVKNDVAISSVDRVIYVLLITSELGGKDPSINSNWFPVTAPTTGVTDLVAENGVENTRSGTNPILENTGIITVRPGSNVSITGTASNPVVNVAFTSPRFCNLFASSTAVITGFPVTGTTTGEVIFGTSLSTFFNDCIANGPPDGNGCFWIDLTSFNFKLTGNPATALLSDGFRISAVDTALNLRYFITAQYITAGFFPTPVNVTLGSICLKVSQLRDAGLRAVNGFYFSLPNASLPTVYNLTSFGNITAVYSPTST